MANTSKGAQAALYGIRHREQQLKKLGINTQFASLLYALYKEILKEKGNDLTAASIIIALQDIEARMEEKG